MGSFSVAGVIFALSTCLKLLLVPSYKSTDFEVHRNWLAITHSLPVSKWYYEDASEWTLDYPPLFAWFEYVLSQFAAAVDPEMVRLSNQNYASFSCVLFQRLSVMVADLVLLYGTHQYCNYYLSRHGHTPRNSRKVLLLCLLLLFNFGLFIVDHIHFQYNGLLFGILLLSITRVCQGRLLEGGLLFAVLLNFKHLFLYIAPVYFVYLLKHFCFSKGAVEVRRVHYSGFSLARFLALGGAVAAVFAVSFGPFVWMGQIKQVLSRLFPFKRGLCHAYWAANFWALYNMADKMAAVAGVGMGWTGGGGSANTSSGGGSMTSGLVGEMQHQMLPPVPPWCTMLLTLVAISPALVKLWSAPSGPKEFLQCLLLCAYGSFLFGWHVHEKAVMIITIPMSLLAIESSLFGRLFVLVTVPGHVALFPLLYQPAELLPKVLLFVLYTGVTVVGLSLSLESSIIGDQNRTSKKKKDNPSVERTTAQQRLTSFGGFAIFSHFRLIELLYLGILCASQIYCLFLHPLVDRADRFPFLPLLITSVSCGVGVVWSWLVLYARFLFGGPALLAGSEKKSQ